LISIKALKKFEMIYFLKMRKVSLITDLLWLIGIRNVKNDTMLYYNLLQIIPKLARPIYQKKLIQTLTVIKTYNRITL